MRTGLLIRVAAASGAVTVAPMPTGRGLLPLADVPDRERSDCPPELVVRREYAVIPMPVLPRRRTRSVRAAKSAAVTGRAGRKAGSPSELPAAPAGSPPELLPAPALSATGR
jgi:hypothetical protein